MFETAMNHFVHGRVENLWGFERFATKIANIARCWCWVNQMREFCSLLFGEDGTHVEGVKWVAQAPSMIV